MLIKKLYAQIYPPLYVNKHDSSKWAKILISRARRKDYDCDALTSLCCTYLKNESSSKSAKAPRNMATKGYSLTQKWLRSQLHLRLTNFIKSLVSAHVPTHPEVGAAAQSFVSSSSQINPNTKLNTGVHWKLEPRQLSNQKRTDQCLVILFYSLFQ